MEAQFMRHKAPKMTQAQIVPICPVKNVLRRIIGVYGKASAVIVRETDLLKTRKAAH